MLPGPFWRERDERGSSAWLGAVPGAVPTHSVLTVAQSEQQARLARRAQQEYSLGHGGARVTAHSLSQSERVGSATYEPFDHSLLTFRQKWPSR